MNSQVDSYEGRCSCGYVHYKLEASPLIVHCCHCRFCQRQTGSAFVLNALYEAKHVELIRGDVSETTVSSPSGKGQKIARCPKCLVAIWSNYSMSGIKDLIRFIRVGTMDNPDLLSPDVHIYTSTKQPWVVLPKDAIAVDEFYDYEEVWTSEKLERRKALLALSQE